VSAQLDGIDPGTALQELDGGLAGAWSDLEDVGTVVERAELPHKGVNTFGIRRATLCIEGRVAVERVAAGSRGVRRVVIIGHMSAPSE
jgi:hypothetical protein